jgi:hypothetical protein
MTTTETYPYRPTSDTYGGFVSDINAGYVTYVGYWVGKKDKNPDAFWTQMDDLSNKACDQAYFNQSLYTSSTLWTKVESDASTPTSHQPDNTQSTKIHLSRAVDIQGTSISFQSGVAFSGVPICHNDDSVVQHGHFKFVIRNLHRQIDDLTKRFDDLYNSFYVDPSPDNTNVVATPGKQA